MRRVKSRHTVVTCGYIPVQLPDTRTGRPAPEQRGPIPAARMRAENPCHLGRCTSSRHRLGGTRSLRGHSVAVRAVRELPAGVPGAPGGRRRVGSGEGLQRAGARVPVVADRVAGQQAGRLIRARGGDSAVCHDDHMTSEPSPVSRDDRPVIAGSGYPSTELLDALKALKDSSRQSQSVRHRALRLWRTASESYPNPK